MATVLSAQAATTYPRFMPEGQYVASAHGVYEIATALAKDTIVGMCWVPGGCEVIAGWLKGDDLDTDGSEELDLDVGYSGNADILGNFGVLNGDAVTNVYPEAGLHLDLFGELKDGPVVCETDTRFDITVTAAAKAGGTGTLSLELLYRRTQTVGT